MTDGQIAIPDKDALKPYLAAKNWQLIPLHHYGDCDTQKGKKRQLGKAPKHNNWNKRPYSSFNAKKHMDAGDNVGVRLKPDQLIVDVDPRNFPDGQTLDTWQNPFVELVLWTGMNPDDYLHDPDDGVLAEMKAKHDPVPWASKAVRNEAISSVKNRNDLKAETKIELLKWIACSPYFEDVKL